MSLVGLQRMEEGHLAGNPREAVEMRDLPALKPQLWLLPALPSQPRQPGLQGPLGAPHSSPCRPADYRPASNYGSGQVLLQPLNRGHPQFRKPDKALDLRFLQCQISETPVGSFSPDPDRGRMWRR